MEGTKDLARSTLRLVFTLIVINTSMLTALKCINVQLLSFYSTVAVFLLNLTWSVWIPVPPATSSAHGLSLSFLSQSLRQQERQIPAHHEPEVCHAVPGVQDPDGHAGRGGPDPHR